MRFDDTLIGIKHCRDYGATASVNEEGAQYCTGMFTVRRPTVSSVTAHTTQTAPAVRIASTLGWTAAPINMIHVIIYVYAMQ